MLPYIALVAFAAAAGVAGTMAARHYTQLTE